MKHWEIYLRRDHQPVIILGQRPSRSCPDCHGDGGWSEDYGHPETGEYDGTRDVLCHCSTNLRAYPLLWLPRRLFRCGWCRTRPCTCSVYTDPPF